MRKKNSITYFFNDYFYNNWRRLNKGRQLNNASCHLNIIYSTMHPFFTHYGFRKIKVLIFIWVKKLVKRLTLSQIPNFDNFNFHAYENVQMFWSANLFKRNAIRRIIPKITMIFFTDFGEFFFFILMGVFFIFKFSSISECSRDFSLRLLWEVGHSLL